MSTQLPFYGFLLSSSKPCAPWPQPLISAFVPALLNNQVPPNPVQIEEKLLPPSVTQHNTEAEKQLIREVRPWAGGEGAGRWGPAGDRLQNDTISPPPSRGGWYSSLPLELRKLRLREVP